MRTALPLPRNARLPRKPRVPQLYCAEIVRACEAAAIRLKLASDELAAHWATLTQACAQGSDLTDLVAARSRCQVLEARVRERATALAEARLRLEQAGAEEATAPDDQWAATNVAPARLFDDESSPWAFLTHSSPAGFPLAG